MLSSVQNLNKEIDVKKLLVISLLTSLSLPVFAQQAGFTGPGSEGQQQGGFNGPHKTFTVAQSKTLQDDAKVTLQGKITKKISHEHYEFMDSTGTVVVEIDDHKWMGQSVSPNDTVRLEGEVDKDANKIDIDVKKVTLVK
nr:NirD/YgiW/YdeI family stress tolerance protein [Rosenbergiella epipactidis]